MRTCVTTKTTEKFLKVWFRFDRYHERTSLCLHLEDGRRILLNADTLAALDRIRERVKADDSTVLTLEEGR